MKNSHEKRQQFLISHVDSEEDLTVIQFVMLNGTSVLSQKVGQWENSRENIGKFCIFPKISNFFPQNGQIIRPFFQKIVWEKCKMFPKFFHDFSQWRSRSSKTHQQITHQANEHAALKLYS